MATPRSHDLACPHDSIPLVRLSVFLSVASKNGYVVTCVGPERCNRIIFGGSIFRR